MSQEELEQIEAYNEAKKLEIPEEWKVYKITRKAIWTVSNWGNVLRNGELYTCRLNRGYLTFGRFKLHRAVAELYIPNPENNPCVDHINTIRSDNFVWNLRWLTHKENCNNPITREHYSESHIGLQAGDKNPFYGKHHDEETKIKIRNSQILKPVVCLKDDQIIKIYEAMHDVKKDGFNIGHVCLCCQGKQKSHKGFNWMYLSNYKKARIKSLPKVYI